MSSEKHTLTKEEVWEQIKAGAKRSDLLKLGVSKRLSTEMANRHRYYMMFLKPIENLLIDMSYRDFSRMCGKEIKKSNTDFKSFTHTSVKGSNDVEDA